MKQITLLAYSLDFSISNKYLEAIKQYLEPKISDYQDEFCIQNFLLHRIKPQLSGYLVNILSFRDMMILSKYLFDKA